MAKALSPIQPHQQTNLGEDLKLQSITQGVFTVAAKMNYDFCVLSILPFSSIITLVSVLSFGLSLNMTPSAFYLSEFLVHWQVEIPFPSSILLNFHSLWALYYYILGIFRKRCYKAYTWFWHINFGAFSNFKKTTELLNMVGLLEWQSEKFSKSFHQKEAVKRNIFKTTIWEF